MDPINEQILTEARILDAIKKIVPTIKNALTKGDYKTMERIANKLPQKEFRTMEREALRKIPGFKLNYMNWQRFMAKDRNAKGMEEPAAFVTTVIESAVGTLNADQVAMKLSEATKHAQKLIFFPGDIKVLKLILFIILILAIYLTKGSIILPAFQHFLSGMSFIMSMLSKLLTSIAKSVKVAREEGPGAIEDLKQGVEDIFS